MACTGVCLLVGGGWAQVNQQKPNSGIGITRQQSGAVQPSARTQQLYHAKDLIGREVRDAQANRLGAIDDILFNPQNGETFAAIGAGSGRYALVPWRSLNVTSTGTQTNGYVTLNTTQEALRAGPTLTSDHWPDLNDPSFISKVYGHYNLQAPSSMGGTSDGPGGTLTGGKTSVADPGRPVPPSNLHIIAH